MRTFYSLILTLIIVLPGFRQAWVFIDFKLHQVSIIEQFCENKENSEMNCKGKCHLRKQLKKTNESKENQIPKITDNRDRVVFPNLQEKEKKATTKLVLSNRPFFLNKIIPSSYISETFRPPPVSVL